MEDALYMFKLPQAQDTKRKLSKIKAGTCSYAQTLIGRVGLRDMINSFNATGELYQLG